MSIYTRMHIVISQVIYVLFTRQYIKLFTIFTNHDESESHRAKIHVKSCLKVMYTDVFVSIIYRVIIKPGKQCPSRIERTRMVLHIPYLTKTGRKRRKAAFKAGLRKYSDAKKVFTRKKSIFSSLMGQSLDFTN